jgi:uncharacterized protein (DUF433 family)
MNFDIVSSRKERNTMPEKDELLKRIEVNPEIMIGKPTIRGTRLTVGYILGLLAEGWPINQILAEYDHITADDIAACLLFAQETVDHVSFIPLASDNS